MDSNVKKKKQRKENNANTIAKVFNNGKEEKEDIISNLPKDIISQILSLLCTKDTVTTSAQSKKWNPL